MCVCVCVCVRACVRACVRVRVFFLYEHSSVELARGGRRECVVEYSLGWFLNLDLEFHAGTPI